MAKKVRSGRKAAGGRKAVGRRKASISGKPGEWEVSVAGSDRRALNQILAALRRMGLPGEETLTAGSGNLPKRLGTVFKIDYEGVDEAELERLREWSTSKEAHEPILQRILRQQEPKDPNWPRYVWGKWEKYAGGESFSQEYEIRSEPLHAIGASSVRDLMREVERLPTHPVGDGKCQLIRERAGGQWVPRCAGDCDQGTCKTKLHASAHIVGISCSCG